MASEPNVRYTPTATIPRVPDRKIPGAAAKRVLDTAAPPRRRQEILRVATALFAERGYHATSMQDIGDALGVQRGSLYHHIQSKEDLLFEILRSCSTTLLEAAEPIVASPIPAAEKFTRFIEAHLDTLISLRPEFRVLIRELKSLPPARREKIIKYRDRYEHLVRRIIAEGVAAGEYRRVDSKYAGFVVLGACNWVSSWYSPRGSLSRAEIAREFADLLLGGIAAAPAASSRRRRSRATLPAAGGTV